MTDLSRNLTARLSKSEMAEWEWRARGVLNGLHHSIVSVTALVDIDAVILTDDFGQRYEPRSRRSCRTLCEYFGLRVALGQYHAAELILGVEFTIADRCVLARTATLEEAAAAFAQQLREPGGFALTRARADSIAATLDTLRQRASQPARQP